MRKVCWWYNLLRITLTIKVIVIGTFFSGCAFGRKSIYLDTGFSAHGNKGPDNSLAVIIDKVEDLRVFSLDNGLKMPSIGLSSLFSRLDDSENSRKRLVGRIANGWGCPCGDVCAQNTTVADHVWKIVEQSFLDAGFSVVSGSQECPNVIHVSVGIENFWGWVCYAYSSDARIRVELEGDGVHEVIIGSASSTATAVWGTDGEWRDLFVDNAAKLKDDLVRQFKTLSLIFRRKRMSWQ